MDQNPLEIIHVLSLNSEHVNLCGSVSYFLSCADSAADFDVTTQEETAPTTTKMYFGKPTTGLTFPCSRWEKIFSLGERAVFIKKISFD